MMGHSELSKDDIHNDKFIFFADWEYIMTSPDLMMPHEAGKFISEHSEDVKISAEGVSKVAAMVSTVKSLIEVTPNIQT